MELSIVDSATVIPGETRHDALIHSIGVAQYAEKLAFKRIWVGSGSVLLNL